MRPLWVWVPPPEVRPAAGLIIIGLRSLAGMFSLFIYVIKQRAVHCTPVVNEHSWVLSRVLTSAWVG